MKKRFSLVMAFVCVILLPVAAFAQTGSLDGVVRNASSLFVQGVDVKAVDVNDEYTFFQDTNGTDASGAYLINPIDQGTYDLHLLRSNSSAVITPGPVSATFDVTVYSDMFVAGGGSNTQDLTLPNFVQVTGLTRAGITAAGNVNVMAVATGANAFDCMDSDYSANSFTAERAVGAYTLNVLPGVYDFTVTYPDTTVVTKDDVTVSGNTTLNFTKGTVPAITGAQKLSFDSTGGTYWATYNYASFEFLGGNVGAGTSTIDITVPPSGAWLGGFLYDYDSAAWDRGIYMLSESYYN